MAVADFSHLDESPVARAPAPWYAIRVRPNFVHVASKCLREKGFEEFTPFYSVKRRWSDRVREIQVPLFSGYMFCRFHVEQLLPVLRTAGVLSVVAFDGRPARVDEDELASLQSIVQAGAALAPWPYLRVGQTVRLCSGPLRGLQGLLLDLGDGLRVVVSVSLLCRSVAVEVDRGDLEPVL